jgi:sortase A
VVCINKKVISIVLIVLGVLIAAYPVVGQFYARYQEEKMLEEWLNSIDAGELEDASAADPEAAYARLQETFGNETAGSGTQDAAGTGAGPGTGDSEDAGAQSGNTETNAGSGTGAGSSSGSDLSNQKVLGIIQIPKIKVKDPIVEGVEKSNLSAGIGHIPGTPLPGQPGNCALAGHRNYTLKKLFRRLDELEAGDEVIIITKTETLKYTVTGKVVVEPDDVSVLAGSKNMNIISLITCTPMYVHSHRLIVTAELTERVPKEP